MNFLKLLNQNKAFLTVSSVALYYGYNQMKDLMANYCKCHAQGFKKSEDQKSNLIDR